MQLTCLRFTIIDIIRAEMKNQAIRQKLKNIICLSETKFQWIPFIAV